MDIRREVDDVDVRGLALLHLGRDGAETEIDLVTSQWHVLSFDAEEKMKG